MLELVGMPHITPHERGTKNLAVEWHTSVYGMVLVVSLETVCAEKDFLVVVLNTPLRLLGSC